MIKEKFVTLYWNPKNKNFYTDKGYNFTKYKEAFRVDVKICLTALTQKSLFYVMGVVKK